MTVVDTSVLVDYLIAGRGPFRALARRERELSGPDVLVFETLAVMRRQSLRGSLDAARAHRAVARLPLLPLVLAPTLPLSRRAWELRHNLTPADALFVALAERLDEPLVTKDARLAAAAETHSDAAVELAV